MERLFCDRCNKEIKKTSDELLIKIQYKKDGYYPMVADLCEDCEKAVYDFIFGGEKKNGDESNQALD